ncbi:MAG: cytochrome P460 family protein [Bryobacteraceae bacterium]
MRPPQFPRRFLLIQLRQIPFILIATACAAAQTSSPAPTISAAGIVNAASLSRTASATLAPGSIATIFGENLSTTTALAESMPWATALGGVSVTFAGMPAAVLYVSPRQVNVQVPWSVLEFGQTTRMAPVVVTRGGLASMGMDVSIGRSSPAIFTSSGMGTGPAVAMNASDGTIAQPSRSGARPARIGSVIAIYATGQGPVSPTLPTGRPTLDVNRRNTILPEVLIGGRQAQVLYAGLAPNVPGINQINAVVPEGVAAGGAVPLQIRSGGVTSTDRVTIAVDSAMEPAAPLPGATAADVWNYLSRQNHRQNFPLIEGKRQLYSGIPPHNNLLTVQVSPNAQEAINRKAGSFPAGSFIAKDAHGPDKNLLLSYIMFKIPGFDPTNNDWFYSTRRPDGSFGASGAEAGCIGCHARSKANDYVFLANVVPNPAPNAAAVRQFLANSNYREAWRLWPGTMEKQASAAPHGATVSIWLNELAYNAIQSRAGRMPDGALIVKENFMPDRTLAALTVMYKSTGFDPANNDWYWLQQTADGTAAAEGRVQGCTNCHNAVASNDLLYTGSIAPLPEPRSATVWPYLQAQDYQKKWTLMPGTTAQMPGNSPHGALITTYVNDIALNAITAKRGTIPPGGMVLKENYMPDRTLAAVTLMYKAEGFNPDGNDWYWMQRTANGMVPAEGRVAGCINCHSANAGNDFLFLSPLK